MLRTVRTLRHVLLLAMLSHMTHLQAFADDVLARIVADWTQRQEEVETLEVEWSATHSLGIGALRPAALSPTQEPEPSQPFTYSDPSVQMWIDGTRFRYEHDQTNYGARVKGRPFSRYTSAFDGETSADFTSQGSDEYARGIISAAATYDDINNYNLWPFLLWCRPLLVVDVARLRLFDDAAGNGDSGELALRVSSADDSTDTAHIWVDPTRDSIVTRYLALDHGLAKLDIELSYSENASLKWNPREWTINCTTPRGATLTAVEANVARLLVNRPIAAQTFRLEFPPDTVVADRRVNIDYLVLPHGGKRVITKAERMHGFTLDGLRRTQPAELERVAQRPKQQPWWLYANLVVLLVIIAVVLRRRRNKQVDNPST